VELLRSNLFGGKSISRSKSSGDGADSKSAKKQVDTLDQYLPGRSAAV
jgi:hypothetical protein